MPVEHFALYAFTLLCILLAYMCIWFVVSIVQKRNDVADVAWGLGFVLLAWVSLVLTSTSSTRGLLVALLVTIWGVRLAWHIHRRHTGKPEDARYAAWRTTWTYFYTRSFVQVFMLQGLLLYVVALPIIITNYSHNALAAGATQTFGVIGILDIVGIIVWCIGFAFEVVGDAQLARFLGEANNKGKLMQGGLWAYTRHPNYFGEVCLWWGIWLISLSSGMPYAWVGIIGPLTITFLILKVSGVPMLEKSMSKNSAFASYAARTNMFVPWFRMKRH
jgi:steroid 5-alpha reductase family enzyme